MALGDKGPALALSEQAMAVVPLEKDAVDGPPPIEVLARLPVQSRRDSKIVTANVSGIFDMIPEADSGHRTPLSLKQQQADNQPSRFTVWRLVALINVMTLCQRLQGDPRFEKIVASLAPK
jgi:hypothetical protein